MQVCPVVFCLCICLCVYECVHVHVCTYTGMGVLWGSNVVCSDLNIFLKIHMLETQSPVLQCWTVRPNKKQVDPEGRLMSVSQEWVSHQDSGSVTKANLPSLAPAPCPSAFRHGITQWEGFFLRSCTLTCALCFSGVANSQNNCEFGPLLFPSCRGRKESSGG